MAIKNYINKAAYDAAPKSAIESQVSMLESTKEVIYDGVNVITQEPVMGDPFFLDEGNNPVFIKASTLVKANIPSAWTAVGQVKFRVNANHVLLLNKGVDSKKYANVLQYALTAISSTSLTLKLRMRDTSKTSDAQYATDIEIPVTLTSTDFDATTVAEITAALEAKATELGDTRDWWCYLANNNNEKVESDATRIVVQCDQWNNYQEYNCGAVGGTIAFATWGDMPANSSQGFRVNGLASNQRIMNVTRGSIYYGTNGRTPDANVPLNEAATIVTSAAFASSPYCAALRAAYGTYENYIRSEYKIAYPQKLGAFSLPDGATLTKKYGPLTAPTKSGGTMVKFPALNWPLSIGYNADGLRQGDWHLWDVAEGSILMDDDNLAIINATRAKQGDTEISNGSYRWFAQRSNVTTAWSFNGNRGNLDNSNVNNTYQVGAVTLYKFK